MKVLTSMFIAAIPVGWSFIIPPDLPEGNHIVSLLDENDHSNHTIVSRKVWKTWPEDYRASEQVTGEEGSPWLPGAPDRDNKTAPPDIIPLPVSEYDCVFNLPTLPFRGAEQARRGLLSYCDNYMLPEWTRHLALSRAGDVVYYACNQLREPQTCSRNEFLWAEHHFFDLRCGALRPAWVKMKGIGKVYGRSFAGMPICVHEDKEKEKKMINVSWVGSPDDEEDDMSFPDD